MSSDKDRVEAANLPPNYRTVLDVVEQAGHGRHLTAQEIWVKARALQPRIGFATVHRGLSRLHELGAVLKIDVPGEASAVYEPSASAHAHFRCTVCGVLSDLDYAVPARDGRRPGPPPRRRDRARDGHLHRPLRRLQLTATRQAPSPV